MADATSATRVPDPSIVSLVSRIIGRHRDALGGELKQYRERVAAEMAARGTLRSGAYVIRLRDGYTASVRQYAEVVTREVLDVVQNPDGSLDPDAAKWVRDHLEGNFEALAVGIGPAIENDVVTRGLGIHLGDHVGAAAAALKRDLGITLDRAALKRPAIVPEAPVTDEALIDELVRLRNRRGYNSDLPELLTAAGHAGEPVALLAFDVDKFKSVNDDHGGHLTGDEALIGVARIAEACAKGKGTAYRLSGDEFRVVLPNHTTQEALAVAERLRRKVNETSLTSRNLTISVSIGVAEFPVHGDTVEHLDKAADAAAYDAKNLGRNLVRIFGEPTPAAPGPRIPERKEASPEGLTDEQRRQIRLDYFRTHAARCPKDGALLNVQDVTGFGQATNSIVIACPFCGLADEID